MVSPAHRCNDPTIGSYNHYHLSPNSIPVRREPISKSCEITQADNLNRRRRLSRKAQ